MKECTFLNIVIEVLLDQKTSVNKYSRVIEAVGTISIENDIPIVIVHKSY